jgi:hypothetical protein
MYIVSVIVQSAEAQCEDAVCQMSAGTLFFGRPSAELDHGT